MTQVLSLSRFPHSINDKLSITIDEDIVDMPVISSGVTLTLKYEVNGVVSGRLMLVLSSSEFFFCLVLYSTQAPGCPI